MITTIFISCDRIFAPDSSVNPHSIFFSVDGNIYKMDYNGSNKTQLTFDEEDNNNPQVKNDGSLLLYETQDNIGRIISGGLMYDYSVVNIMNLNNQNMVTITDTSKWCFNPSMSLDNQSIVFCSYLYQQGKKIVISNINGKILKNITDYGTYNNPIFIDENTILFEFDHDQKTDLFTIDIRDNNVRQLTDSEWNINAVLSPDGTNISWESYYDINIMDINGNSKVNLTNNKNIFSRTPSFSHSGEKIVFITERTYNDPNMKNEIHIMDLKTNDRKIILDTGYNFEPKFFPDDNKILFAQYENSQFYICVINTNGSGYTKLCRGGNPCVY